METKQTNLRNRPSVTEYQDAQAMKGSGKLDSINAFLRNDPVSYFYQKFKSSNNEFLRDDFWSEAAKRGESDNLVGLLNATNDEKFSREAYDILSGYGDRMDYDAYMLSLQIPHLDNETKVDRIDETTGHKFGSYTDQEWGMKVVESMIGRWDAEIIEEDKANRGWLKDVTSQVQGGLLNVLGGIYQFLGDVWNLGEGLIYLLADWSNESNKDFMANRGEKFLKAFANDDEGFNLYGHIGEWLQGASFEYQRKYATTVNAVAAYEQGYMLGEGSNFLQQIDNTVGVGAGYTTWGRWMNAGSNAVGYMIPTIVLGVLTSGSSTAGTAAGIGAKTVAVLNKARSAIFYAGIFSGMVKDSVVSAQMKGISYKDLNAGKVLANAAIKSAAQYAVEVGLGMIIGFSGVDRLLGISSKGAASAGAARAAAAGGVRAAGHVILGGAKAALKEGLEETLQELSDMVIDYGFGGDYRERAVDNFSIQTLTDAFIVGALTSVVMGSVANTTVFVGANRAIGVDPAGQAFKLGAFQTLSLRQAMQSMHNWKETINDPKASIEAKAKAMLALNASIATLGDVYRNMGTERAVKADAVIMDILNMESKTERIKAFGNEVEYSNKLWEDFTKAQAQASLKYMTSKLEAKIKKAIDKERAKLRQGRVSKLGETVTADSDINDPNLTTPAEAQAKLKSVLSKLGVEAIVSVDGNIVTKSDEVLFVSDALLKAGDVETIIKGVAYDLALETVKANLSDNQKKLIVQSYSKITGLNGSLDDAVTALLFDKNFYTYTLLRMQERHYKNPAFEILATLDQLITNKVTPNIANGTVTEQAYKHLLTKVQKTMRDGLVTFATNYNRIDLGLVDNTVLPTELKAIITNHRNVRFSEMVDEGLSNKTNTPNDFDRIQAFDAAITKYESHIAPEILAELKNKARSKNYNDRVDAYTALVLYSKTFDQTDKVIYLPVFGDSNLDTIGLQAIEDVEAQFGVKWLDLVNGTYDPNNLTAEIQDFIVTNGYNMANTESRLAAIKHVLYHKSAKNLTLGTDGVIMRIIEKHDFVKDEYLDEQGNKKLLEDLRSGKVKTIGDIIKANIDKRIASIKLTLDATVLRAGINGGYVDGADEIILSGNDVVNTVMHEATHAAQSFFATNKEYIGGGTTDIFDNLPIKVKASLLAYIKANFPTSFKLITNPHNGSTAIMYFMLAGELQANTTLSSLFFETGFRWKQNKTVLVSPDGIQEWSMEASKRKVSSATKAANKIVKKTTKLMEETNKILEQMAPKPNVVEVDNDNDNDIDPDQNHSDTTKITEELLKKDYHPFINELVNLEKPTVPQRKALAATKALSVLQVEEAINKNSDVQMTRAERSLFYAVKSLLTNLPKWRGPEVKTPFNSSLQALIAANKFYTKYPELKLWVEGFKPTSKNADVTQARLAKEDSLKLLYNELFKPSHSRPSLTKFFKTPIYFVRSMANTEIKSEVPMNSVYVSYDPKTISIWIKGVNEGRDSSGRLIQKIADNMFVGQILPKDLIAYLPQSGTEALVSSDILTNAKIIKAKDISTTKDGWYHRQWDVSEAREALAALPIGLNADEPLTIEALHELRDDPTIKRYIEKGWLKREDGTPMVFYRGWDSWKKGTEIHLAQDGKIPIGFKVGEFYSTDYTLSDKFGNKIEGFITNVTKDQTKVYELKNADWLDLQDFYTPEDILVKKQLFDLSRPFKTSIAVATTLSFGRDIESFLLPRLNIAERKLWESTISNLMENGKLERDNVVAALVAASRWDSMDRYRTDELLPINLLQGYKAILMNDVNEVLGQGISTNLVLLRGTSPKKVTHKSTDINWDKVIKPETTRYISNQIAKRSNLKYFIKKGVPIQLDPKVAAFVVQTTESFEQLPKVLRDKIVNGTLNKFDLIDYVSTAKSINDFTFQAIAKYVYNNDAMANLTFKDAQLLAENIADIAALALVVESTELVRTPFEMFNLLKVINKRANSDKELGENLIKARKNAQTVLINGLFQESFADPKQLLPIMMRHYTGTLTSVRHVNNFGKLLSAKQEAQRLIENSDTDKINTVKGTWNWIDKIKRADMDYEYDEGTLEALEDLTKREKIKAIEDYITNELISRVNKMTDAQKRDNAQALQMELEKSLEGLNKLSDEAINKRYLAVLANETEKAGKRKLEALVKPEPADITAQPRSTKNIKDHVRQAARTVTQRIAGLKRRYNSLPKSVQEAIDPKTYKLRTEYYSKMTDQQLETLLTNLKEASKRLNASIKEAEILAANTEKNKQRLEKLAAKNIKSEAKPKRSLKEKVDVVHKTTVVNQDFTFDSREKITKSAQAMLDTQWKKRTMSRVQGLTNNVQQNVHNGKLFFEYNAETLMNMSTAEAELTVKWFMDANIVGIAADSTEAQTYTAIKTYFLGYVLGQAKDGGQFHNFSPNLRMRLENHLRTQTSVAGTTLAVWNNIQGLINPLEVMMNTSMEIAGVVLTDTEKESLLLAAISNDIEAIAKAQQLIIERVNVEKTTKKTILRKLTTLRSMSMLSNPVTWLRNRISNFMLKRLNKVATSIGNQIASNKTAKGQFKMDGVITPEIQAFINEHFLDNRLFELLVSNLSRYNPSDIQSRFKDDTGKAAKDAIFANMVIKSLYNQFYNQNLFNSPQMNKLHGFLMKMLSDNNYVREASIRYFGKIMAERAYALNQGVTDAIMNDFAVAIGMGMADYMHSDNFFNQFETMLAERSEVGLFAYKLLLPFGSASWNWFKAAVKFSPIGLGQSIYKLSTLEQQIIKAETNWAKGKGQVSPELTEYLIRRDLGSGVIGTMSMLFGMMLAGLGYVELEEDDYGVPKLRIGDLRIDVSTIFGSSSVLAGMALVKSWETKDYMAGIDAMLDPLLDGFFLVQILEMDKYNNKGWGSMGIAFFEQTLLSFIPNGFRWLSGATYTGKYKTNNFFERAVARIPFFGSVFGLEKRVNPYTGDLGDAWDIFNRVVPFFEVRKTSFIEDDAKALGVNKDELRGKYEINGEKFELSAKDTAALNRMYGQWNADALVAFYNNQTRYSVKMPNGSFRELTYNQMTEDQRRNALQNLFNKHAEYAKIQAWLNAGNIYYASTTDYVTLKKLGVTGSLYKGNRGFVKK